MTGNTALHAAKERAVNGHLAEAQLSIFSVLQKGGKKFWDLNVNYKPHTGHSMGTKMLVWKIRSISLPWMCPWMSSCGSQVSQGPRRARTQMFLVSLGCFGFIFNLLGKKEAVPGDQPRYIHDSFKPAWNLRSKPDEHQLPSLERPKERRRAGGWSDVSEAPVRVCLSWTRLKQKERKANKSSSNYQLQLMKHGS